MTTIAQLGVVSRRSAHPLNRSLSSHVTLLTVAALLLGGCQGDPYYPSYTKREPNPKDIVGTYVPDERTAGVIRSRKGLELLSTQIVIRADGTYSIDNVPEWNNAMSASSVGPLVTRSGTWHLEQPQKAFWVVSILYRNGSTDTYDGINLREQKPPYLLHFTLGDPDSGESMVFTKQQ